MRTLPDEFLRLVREAQTIAVCSHVNPDGDAIGSGLALRLALLSLGKRVYMVCQDKVPDVYAVSLEGAEQYAAELPAERVDLLLCADISDERRMGSCAPLLGCCAHSAQIDHHGTNTRFCEVNVVDAAAPATGVLVYALIRQLGVALTADMARCLYAAISTDTGNFAFSCTDAETFEIMADLMRCGLPLAELNRAFFRVRPRCQVELLSRALSSLTFHHGGEVASMRLSRRDFDECGALPEHADTVVNFGLDIHGVKMAVLAREHGTDAVKMSLRAVDGCSVAEVAHSFGGGGHKQAAGCTLTGTLDECLDQAVAALCRACDEQR